MSQVPGHYKLPYVTHTVINYNFFFLMQEQSRVTNETFIVLLSYIRLQKQGDSVTNRELSIYLQLKVYGLV